MAATSHVPSDPDELVESHLYMVQHIVNQLASRYPRHIDRSELWSAGAAGLVDASRRYDPATGVPFSRYASIRIRGAIIDSTRTRDWATRSLRREMRTLSTTASDFEQQHGRCATTAELAELLGLSVDEVASLQSAAQAASLLHLDQPVGPAPEDGTFGDRIPEQVTQHLPEEAIEQQELVGTVRTAVELLPDVQRRVLEAYFFEGRLLRDIAEDLGVTEARVSQIRSEALTAIQAYFADAFGGVPNVPRKAPGIRRRAAFVANVATASTWRSRLDAGHGIHDGELADATPTSA